MAYLRPLGHEFMIAVQDIKCFPGVAGKISKTNCFDVGNWYLVDWRPFHYHLAGVCRSITRIQYACFAGDGSWIYDMWIDLWILLGRCFLRSIHNLFVSAVTYVRCYRQCLVLSVYIAHFWPLSALIPSDTVWHELL
jgi:hypothetical protein